MIDHGTHRGYRQHRRLGEDACRPCKDAQAAHEREYQKQRYLTRGRPLLVPALGAQRRIRALVRMGWRYQDIAAIAFPNSTSSKQFIKAIMGRQTMHRSTFEAIDRAYSRLSANRGPSQQNATLALNRGWPPPLAWDDIDDANEKPQGYLRPSEIKKLVNGKA